MNEMKFGTMLGALLILVSLACWAGAADNPKVTLEAQGTPVRQAMTDVSKQVAVPIMCASSVKGAVSGSFESVDLEKFLDLVTQSNSLKWQKLFLPEQADPKPTAEQLMAQADAISALKGGTIIIYDPATGKQRVFVEQDAAAPSVQPDKLGLKPIYIVSKPKEPVKEAEKPKQDATARYQSLEDERMKLLSEMTPDQRVAAMQQGIVSLMGLDPSTRQQIMMDQMSAQHNMDPQTRDLYQQTMRDTFRAMRDNGMIPDDGHRGGRGGGGPGGPDGPPPGE